MFFGYDNSTDMRKRGDFALFIDEAAEVSEITGADESLMTSTKKQITT